MNYLTTEQLIARDGKALTPNQQALLCLRLKKLNGNNTYASEDHLADVMYRSMDCYKDVAITSIYKVVYNDRTSEPSGEPSQDPWERIAQIAGELQASTQALITAIQAGRSES